MEQTIYDTEEIYCRKLGHTLKFSYCRNEHSGLPCSRVYDCWFERIKIQEFIASSYTEEEQNAISSPQKDRLTTIFDIIMQSSSNNKKDQEK